MQDLIKKYKILAKKALGQNFLVDEKILLGISQITNLKNENILEIGPGFGALTNFILQNTPKSLFLVELDMDMVNILNDRIKNNDFELNGIDFKIFNEDILKYENNFSDYKVVANIPYYITSPIIFKFLYESNFLPKEMIILMQKEVGDRIIGLKGNKTKSSVLSLFVQKKCTVSEKIFVSKKSFSPPPKIDSSVIFFESHDKFKEVNDNEFLAFIKASFSNPRKKMVSNLSNFGYDKNYILRKLNDIGFGENTRPEELKIEDYIYLLK